MKQEQLKKLLMPVIRECIQEILSEPQVAEQLVREGMQRIASPSKPSLNQTVKQASKEDVYSQYVQRSLTNKVSDNVKKQFVNEVAAPKPKSLLEEMLDGVEDIDSRDRRAAVQVSSDDVEELPGSSHWGEILKRL